MHLKLIIMLDWQFFLIWKIRPFGKRSVDFDSTNYIEKTNDIESSNFSGRGWCILTLKKNNSSQKN